MCNGNSWVDYTGPQGPPGTSAICTWSSKTYSTGAYRYTQGNSYSMRWVCQSNGAWYCDYSCSGYCIPGCW